ncbi:hypothetical protein LTR66_015070, partial [Elasticomyces elasticus]
MASDRPHLSITLPRSFGFHSTDGQRHKTPDSDAQVPQVLDPPAPPRQTYRIKRRRPGVIQERNEHEDTNTDMPDAVVPTIEMSEPVADLSGPPPGFATPAIAGYLSPQPSYERFLSPPKTPVHQLSST